MTQHRNGDLLMPSTDILTSGNIARQLNRPVSQVRYVLASRDEFQPCGRAGIVYLYHPSIVPDVEAACAALKPDRRKVVFA